MPVETALYDLLGVHPEASEDDIKKAYRKKAREHHPDKNPDDPLAGQRFQEMAAAYEILSSAETREIYDQCKKCKGRKTVKEKTRQEIFIERGMTDRQKIVLAGAGDEEPGVPAGDVVFVLRTRKHDLFERAGNDLLTTVHITLSEALLGFSRILLTHLDGRGIHVSSPPGKAVQPGGTIVLRGEGMPVHKNSGHKGNLYVILEIDMPDEDWLRSVDRAALERLLPPKKLEMDPRPETIDEVPYEETDMADFGEGDERDWVDEEEEDEEDGAWGAQPECSHQ